MNVKIIEVINHKGQAWVPLKTFEDERLNLAEEHYAHCTAITTLRYLRSRIEGLFDEIAHGDEEHRAWLKKKLEDHFGSLSKRPTE